ncbi:MAG: hypothetical protein F6K17_24170 [Okeania sp. SIO3C4]|nr:hypothetical protein [Okeania sp. SIO3B3]NER05466.1 hypothetical protein [Okeania sp. SIO3C4]
MVVRDVQGSDFFEQSLKAFAERGVNRIALDDDYLSALSLIPTSDT